MAGLQKAFDLAGIFLEIFWRFAKNGSWGWGIAWHSRQRLIGRPKPSLFAPVLDSFGRASPLPDESWPRSAPRIQGGAVLIDLEARTMDVANGPPCANDYVAFAV